MNAAFQSHLLHPSATDVVVLGHTLSDHTLAFSATAADGTLLSQSLQFIEHACEQQNLPRAYFSLGEQISSEQLNCRFVFFFVSHLPAHHLFAQIGALLKAYPKAMVIPVVEYADQAKAAALLELGCVDYLLAPFTQGQCEELLQRLNATQAHAQSFVCESAASRRLLAMAQRVAVTRAPILITGETGTGKELLARYIHDLTADTQAPFVAINCAAIPEAMLESLLFGHERGAFTGAVNAQPGKFELAEGGTLLLDEIGEMPLALQAKLLRVLQEKKVERLGGRKEIPLNVRIIAATNRDLRIEVAEGRFRSDLLFRLDVLPLHIDPLRERKDDVVQLAIAFIKKYAPDENAEQVLSEDARAALIAYDWPGNVRELENLMQRALVLRKGVFIQANDLGLPAASNMGHQQPTDYIPYNFSDAPILGAPIVDVPIGIIESPQHTSPPIILGAANHSNNTPTSSAITLFSSNTPQPAKVMSSNYANDDAALDADYEQKGKAVLKAKGKLAEYEHVLNTIKLCGGHKTKAAEHLGMTTRALRYRLNAMREHGIPIPF